MNDTMRFFLKIYGRVNRVINKITRKLLEDEHIVFHPTVITVDLINSFHTNSDTNVLELGNIFRITKDIPNSNVLYFVVVYKRFGRTYKTKKFLLLDRAMHVVCSYNLDDSIAGIATSVAEFVNNIL